MRELKLSILLCDLQNRIINKVLEFTIHAGGSLRIRGILARSIYLRPHEVDMV